MQISREPAASRRRLSHAGSILLANSFSAGGARDISRWRSEAQPPANIPRPSGARNSFAEFANSIRLAAGSRLMRRRRDARANVDLVNSNRLLGQGQRSLVLFFQSSFRSGRKSKSLKCGHMRLAWRNVQSRGIRQDHDDTGIGAGIADGICCPIA